MASRFLRRTRFKIQDSAATTAWKACINHPCRTAVQNSRHISHTAVQDDRPSSQCAHLFYVIHISLLFFPGGSLRTHNKPNLVTKTICSTLNRSVSSALMHWTSAPATFTPRWRPGTVAFWEAGIDGHLKPPHVARLQGYFPVPEHLSLGTSPSVFRRCNRATQSRRNGRWSVKRHLPFLRDCFALLHFRRTEGRVPSDRCQ